MPKSLHNTTLSDVMMYTIAVNNFVVFFLYFKNFNLDYLKNIVLLVRPMLLIPMVRPFWLSALRMITEAVALEVAKLPVPGVAAL